MVATQYRKPLDSDQVSVPAGQVFVIAERCKGCRFCIEFCPEQVLAESTAINAKGYHYPVMAPEKEDACINCAFCKLVCPEFAIYTEET